MIRQLLSSYYNPRIIQMYLNSVRPENEPKECAYRLLQYLRQPEDFWEQIFQNLSDEGENLFHAHGSDAPSGESDGCP